MHNGYPQPVYSVVLSHALSFPEERHLQEKLYTYAYLAWAERSPLGVWLAEHVGECQTTSANSLPRGQGWYIHMHPTEGYFTLYIERDITEELVTELVLRFGS